MGLEKKRGSRGSTTLIETAIISATVGIVFFTSSKVLAPALSGNYTANACAYNNVDLLSASDEDWDLAASCPEE